MIWPLEAWHEAIAELKLDIVSFEYGDLPLGGRCTGVGARVVLRAGDAMPVLFGHVYSGPGATAAWRLPSDSIAWTLFLDSDDARTSLAEVITRALTMNMPTRWIPLDGLNVTAFELGPR